MSSKRPNCPVSAGLCPYPLPQCGLACVDSWDGADAYERKSDMWVWTERESTMPDFPMEGDT